MGLVVELWTLPILGTNRSRWPCTAARLTIPPGSLPTMNPQVPLRLCVPASTSNLGPGFDCLGLALSLWLELRVERTLPSPGLHWLERSGTAREWPEGPENLIWRAYAGACQRMGLAPTGWELSASSAIPLARGLGSSGAAIAAGIRLAVLQSSVDWPIAHQLEWGLECEGHPDNTTAALLGGLTLAVPLSGGRLRALSLPLAPEWGFALAWSEVRVPTATARGVLPASVPFRDAVENPRRLALLLWGLQHGDEDCLREGSADRLHVVHRLPLIPGGSEALEAAREAGAATATISGSGSTLIAIGAKARMPAAAAAMAQALRRANGSATERVVEPVLGPPRIVREA